MSLTFFTTASYKSLRSRVFDSNLNFKRLILSVLLKKLKILKEKNEPSFLKIQSFLKSFSREYLHTKIIPYLFILKEN